MLLVAGLAAASTASAKPRDPRLEKLALTSADTLVAKNAALRLADLAAGWRGGQAPIEDSLPPECPLLNFSAYTITGESEADFSQRASVVSSIVQVFPDHGQAVGDFQAGLKGDTVACEGAAFAHALARTAKLRSARALAAPKIGDRTAAFRFIVQVGVNTFYADLIEFVRDRAVGGVITINPGAPILGIETLARLVDERLLPAHAA